MALFDQSELTAIRNPVASAITTGHIQNQITFVRAPVTAVQAPTARRNPAETR